MVANVETADLPQLPATLGFLQNISTPEIALVAFVLLLLFGAKRLPALSRSIGESIREFKRSRLEDAEPPANQE